MCLCLLYYFNFFLYYFTTAGSKSIFVLPLMNSKTLRLTIQFKFWWRAFLKCKIRARIHKRGKMVKTYFLGSELAPKYNFSSLQTFGLKECCIFCNAMWIVGLLVIVMGWKGSPFNLSVLQNLINEKVILNI